MSISISPRGVVIIICLSLSTIRSARPIILRVSGIPTLIMLTILIWSILVRIALIIKVAICLGIIPPSVKVLFRAKIPILSRLRGRNPAFYRECSCFLRLGLFLPEIRSESQSLPTGVSHQFLSSILDQESLIERGSLVSCRFPCLLSVPALH